MAQREEPRPPSKPGPTELPRAKINLTNLRKSLRLFSYLQKQKWKFFMGMFFLVATASVGLLFPLKSGSLFGFFGNDSLPREVLKEQLYDLGLVLLLILILQGFFSFGRVYFFTQVT